MVVSYNDFLRVPILNIAGISKFFFLHFVGNRVRRDLFSRSGGEPGSVFLIDRRAEALYNNAAFIKEYAFQRQFASRARFCPLAVACGIG
jgi:hypothetical protein